MKHSIHSNTWFGKRAAKYDGFEGIISRRFYNLLLRQIELKNNDTVLDVGCGTGTVLRRMADVCHINGFGIDIEKNMVAEARKKCPDMDIRVSSCETTPFEDQTFDTITVCMAYHHFSNKKDFAKEASRILKPGGCLLIADPCIPFIPRKTIYGLAELLLNFQQYGFLLDAVAIKGYAEAITLRLGR
jgi:ubiquinone/menaquinone biosynthesis C-methylase UbiE